MDVSAFYKMAYSYSAVYEKPFFLLKIAHIWFKLFSYQIWFSAENGLMKK